MRFYLTRDKADDRQDELQVGKPFSLIKGVWTCGLGCFEMKGARPSLITKFQEEFRLDPGGQPILVEMVEVKSRRSAVVWGASSGGRE